jgi:hypothetical protein
MGSFPWAVWWIALFAGVWPLCCLVMTTPAKRKPMTYRKARRIIWRAQRDAYRIIDGTHALIDAVLDREPPDDFDFGSRKDWR